MERSRKQSEDKLSSELQDPRRTGTRDLPERRGAGASWTGGVPDAGIVPIGMVQSIKRIRLELQAHAFPERQDDCLSQ